MEHVFTDANFDTDVLKSPVPVLVDFWAAWCGPCRAMAPILEELAEEIAETKLIVGKLNVDENPSSAMAYNIMSIPCFLVFKDGKVDATIVGGMSKEAFREKLAGYLA